MLRFIFDSTRHPRPRQSRKTGCTSRSVFRRGVVGGWLAAALVASLLCPAPNAVAQPSPHQRRRHVRLQRHVRVASPRLQQALAAFDASTGVMHFAPVPDAMRVKVGDVLASGPSSSAPFGYLRRVTGVVHGSSEVQLTTVPARLDEAIKEAHVTATVILPTDGSHTATLVPGGLTFPAPPMSAAGLGASHSLDLEYHANGVDLSLHGHETSWVGVNIGVDIDAACLIDGDPCFAFDTEAGEQEDAAVTINGRFNGSFSKSFPLANETFDPIVFFIGPVPVVLVPNLDISFDFDATANGTFAYAAEANAPEYRMSVHWDSANGFSNGFSFQPAHFDPGSIDLVADVDAQAKIPTRVDLLLYDVAGVNAIVTAGLDAKLHIPHKPRWSVDGELMGEIGVNATLPIIGDLGSTEVTLFDEQFHVAESANNPPRVAIQSPINGQQISFSWPDFGNATLFATTSDDEDGTPCCTVDWLLGDGSLLAHGNDVVAPFPRVGHFDLIARATDSDGATTDSAPVGIDTTIPPPGAGIVLPGPACETKIYTNLPVRLLGREGQFLGNADYTCVWFSDADADQPQFPPAEELAGSFGLRGCELDTFFPTPGVRTLTLGVVPDVPGSTASDAYKTLRVLDRPAGPIPLLRSPGPASCEQVGLDNVQGKLDTYVEASGATPGTHLTWTWQAGTCAPVPLPVQRGRDGLCVPGFCPSHFIVNGPDVAAITSASCSPDGTGTATVTAVDASGAANSTLFYIRLFHQIVR